MLVLFYFFDRRQMSKLGRQGKKSWAIKNNGEIVFPYSVAQKKYGISRTQFSRALDQLIKYGFIDINHHGGGMLKDFTTYFISDRWENYATDKFIDKFRKKDIRKLGFTTENWEERTGKKRTVKAKPSNVNDTCSGNVNVTRIQKVKKTSSIRNVTEKKHSLAPLQRAKSNTEEFQLFSNKSVTVL